MKVVTAQAHSVVSFPALVRLLVWSLLDQNTHSVSSDTRMNRSSNTFFGIFIHMFQDCTSWEKPPYVCAHYLKALTKRFFSDMMLS